MVAVLRSGIWPGSRDTCPVCGRPGASRAVRGFWQLVMAVSLMAGVMAVTSWPWSWCGFQAGLRFAGSARKSRVPVRRFNAHRFVPAVRIGADGSCLWLAFPGEALAGWVLRKGPVAGAGPAARSGIALAGVDPMGPARPG